VAQASEQEEVVQATVRLLRKAQTMVPTYGVGFGGVGRSGASTRDLAPIFRETRTRIKERDLLGIVAGVALPTAGGHKIILDPARTRADRMFTIRHELAHILAGEVEYAMFLTSEDTMSFSERRADLFAVADLTPTHWMGWVRGKRRPWRAVTLEVVQAYRELTDGWSEQRLWDRARLRVLLYREYGT
jgi:hypothetical protein